MSAKPRSKGRSGSTISPEYFRTLYAGVDDPWQYATSAYEADKYAASLQALPRERYARALELGCSIGVFTAMLAARCAELLAVDVSSHALERARARCATLPQVRFEQCDLSRTFPAGAFDLVTFCELGFYFGPRDFSRVSDAIAGALAPDGELLLVHWTPLVEGHAQTADDVHEAFLNDDRFAPVRSGEGATYRLDVLRRRASNVGIVRHE